MQMQRRQKMEALAKGNATRIWRKKAKEDVASGKINGTQWALMLKDPPPEIATMKLGKALRVLPGIGQTRAGIWCKQMRLRPDCQLSALSSQQRNLLAIAVTLREETREKQRGQAQRAKAR